MLLAFQKVDNKLNKSNRTNFNVSRNVCEQYCLFMDFDKASGNLKT